MIMQDFIILSTNKTAFDSFVLGQPETQSGLSFALLGRRFELAVRPPVHAWEVPPVPTGETTDFGLPELTTGQGLSTTYSAWLRVWDSEPVDIDCPSSVVLRSRGLNDEGLDVPSSPSQVGSGGASQGVSPFPDMISDRQFSQGLAHAEIITQAEALAWVGPGTLPPAMAAFIAGMPEASRFDIEMVLTGATQFSRSHPLTLTFANAVGMSPQQLDQFWIMCAGL
jgi:hypothetical protein